MTFRPTLVPTLFTVPALISLIVLGVWQLDRMVWKQNLIDQFEARIGQAPQPIPTGPLTPENHEFLQVSVTGKFDNANEFYLIFPSKHGEPGINIITPLAPSDGGPAILVNRGWIPFDRRDKATRPEGLVEGEVTVQGLLRFPKPLGMIRGWVIPENEPWNNTWYWLDTPALAAKAGYDGFTDYYVMSGEEPPPGVYPIGKQWLLDIRNNHLEYAITWFLLAAGLAVIYVVYTMQQQKKPE